MGNPPYRPFRWRSNDLTLSTPATIWTTKALGQIMSQYLVVPKIQNLIKEKKLSVSESAELFQLIETEIMSLHDGNIARFKIRPSEFQEWKSLQ